LFNNPGKQIANNILDDSPKHAEETFQHTNFDSALGSVFGIFDLPQSYEDNEEENFVREHRKKKPQKKRGRGI
jgi:hypothetical protein